MAASRIGPEAPGHAMTVEPKRRWPECLECRIKTGPIGVGFLTIVNEELLGVRDVAVLPAAIREAKSVSHRGAAALSQTKIRAGRWERRARRWQLAQPFKAKDDQH